VSAADLPATGRREIVMNKRVRFIVYRTENGDEVRIAVFDSEQYAVDFIEKCFSDEERKNIIVIPQTYYIGG
jgi:hypothetical protein